MGILNKGYREFSLPNGLVVALQETPTETIAAELRVHSGALHEREGEEGLAHFLEHCLVTGGSQKYDPLQAENILGSFGHTNAYTNIDKTSFVGDFCSEDLRDWLDYTAEHVLRPRLDAQKVEEERGRILSEISDAKSSPTFKINQEMGSIFYRGHPKNKFVLGREEVVKSTSTDGLRDFHASRYFPNNMDLMLVGGLPSNTEEMIRTYFESAQTGENTRREFPRLEPFSSRMVIRRPAPERVNVDDPDQSSAQLELIFSGPTETHPDFYAIRAAGYVLGGGMSSRLFKNIGQRKGLYSINSFNNGQLNVGEIGVSAQIPSKKIDEVTGAIFRELELMKTERIPEEVVTRGRKLLKYNLAKFSESNGGHLATLRSGLDGKPTPRQEMEGFSIVTPERVLEVANKYYPDIQTGNYLLVIRDPLMN
ncbi:insulinase family protein [Candidatus Pacearchaeota archaeon]|nr:insulinase family protein [Candidatus Pacearchaeota archaeon]